MQSQKNEYLKAIEKTLKDWNKKLESLKSKAGEDYEKTREQLGEKCAAAKELAQKIHGASEDTWHDMKEQYEAISHEVHSLFNATKHTYVETVEPQLKDWGTKLEALKCEAAEKKDVLAEDYHNMVEEARERYEHARKEFHTIKEASGDSWKELSVGFEKAWTDFKEAFDRATEKFKQHYN